MIKKGFQTKHKIVYELSILAKYYHDLYKNDDDKVKNKITEFCEKHIEHYNNDEWFNIINKTISITKKSKYITGKEVHITKAELDTIHSLDDIREQKVAFVLLVLYKFYDHKKFEVIIEDLYKLSKLNLNSKTKLKILQSLTSKEFIDITMGGKRWVKFVDKKGKPEITIKDFDDFVYEYMLYIEVEGYSKCQVCNKPIKMTNNRTKYCKGCWSEVKKQQTRERVRKHRKSM